MGVCMEPDYPHHSFAIVDPDQKFFEGDDIVIWFKKGGCSIKRLFMNFTTPGSDIVPCLVVGQLNPRASGTIDEDRIEAVHRVVQGVGKEEAKFVFMDQTSEPKAV